jgi:hypothetical protein
MDKLDPSVTAQAVDDRIKNISHEAIAAFDAGHS